MTNSTMQPSDAVYQLPVNMPADALQTLISDVLQSGGLLPGWPIGKVALSEPEAAECISVKPHVLRDARLRLKLPHTLVGRSVTYSVKQLSECINLLEINGQ